MSRENLNTKQQIKKKKNTILPNMHVYVFVYVCVCRWKEKRFRIFAKDDKKFVT